MSHTHGSSPNPGRDRPQRPAVTSPADEMCRRMAQRLQSENPRWLIVWGPYTREYTAFPLLPVPPGTFVHSRDPRALKAAMEEVERAVAQQPPAPGW